MKTKLDKFIELATQDGYEISDIRAEHNAYVFKLNGFEFEINDLTKNIDDYYRFITNVILPILEKQSKGGDSNEKDDNR